MLRRTTLLAALLAALSTSVSAAIADAAASVVPRILKIGYTHYVPFVYYNDEGRLEGIDVEIAQAACRKLGCTARFIPINWHEKKQLLADRRIDCVWTVFTKDGREGDYQWTVPYLESRQVVLVAAHGPVKTLSDLADKLVATTHDSKAENLLLKTDGVVKPKAVYSLSFITEIFHSLEAGYVDAAAGHESALQFFTRSAPQRWRFLTEPLATVNVAVAFSLTADPALPRALSATLNELQADGTIDAILKKYGHAELSAPDVLRK